MKTTWLLGFLLFGSLYGIDVVNNTDQVLLIITESKKVFKLKPYSSGKVPEEVASIVNGASFLQYYTRLSGSSVTTISFSYPNGTTPVTEWQLSVQVI